MVIWHLGTPAGSGLFWSQRDLKANHQQCDPGQAPQVPVCDMGEQHPLSRIAGGLNDTLRVLGQGRHMVAALTRVAEDYYHTATDTFVQITFSFQ